MRCNVRSEWVCGSYCSCLAAGKRRGVVSAVTYWVDPKVNSTLNDTNIMLYKVWEVLGDFIAAVFCIRLL